MPFDVLDGQQIASLTDLLVHHGVTPVPLKDLEAHKAEQIRLNPPNLLFTPKPYLAFGTIVFACQLGLRYVAVGSVSVGALAACFFFSLVLTGLVTFLLAIVLDSFRIKLRGKAEWSERLAFGFHDPIPLPVREVMEHVRARLPHAKFIYGELTQRTHVLDPYIVVCHKPVGASKVPERACLGIWDDDGIVRLAEIHE